VIITHKMIEAELAKLGRLVVEKSNKLGWRELDKIDSQIQKIRSFVLTRYQNLDTRYRRLDELQEATQRYITALTRDKLSFKENIKGDCSCYGQIAE